MWELTFALLFSCSVISLIQRICSNVAYNGGQAFIKSPYMAARFILITEAADLTSGDFLHDVFSGLGVHCGAAQDMDLFLDISPLLVDLCNCKVKSSGNFFYYREEDV
jgi:hypothetical protein